MEANIRTPRGLKPRPARLMFATFVNVAPDLRLRSRTCSSSSLGPNASVKLRHYISTALGNTSIAVHQWPAKQFWVDRQTFKQDDNIYCLEKVQINKLNVYLEFKLNCDVCYIYESCLFIFPII
jgi:hypothetical protein